MQILVFAGQDYYPNDHLGDFRGMLPARANAAGLPTAEELAQYLSTLLESTLLRPAITRCDWVTLLAVDGQSAPQRQGWDILTVPATWPNPQGRLIKLGCTGCFETKDRWVGVRPNERIGSVMDPPPPPPPPSYPTFQR